jgi:hypothetical protein
MSIAADSCTQNTMEATSFNQGSNNGRIIDITMQETSIRLMKQAKKRLPLSVMVYSKLQSHANPAKQTREATKSTAKINNLKQTKANTSRNGVHIGGIHNAEMNRTQTSHL